MNQIYRIEICDNKRGSALRLERILREKIDQGVIQSVSEEELSAELQDGRMRPDILFISVNLQNEGGISLAARLRQADPLIRVIFLAEKCDDISDIFEAEPVGLLFRPFQEQQVWKALERAILGFQKQEEKYLQVKNREHLVRIKYEDVYYIESDKRNLLIHNKMGVELLPRPF